MFLIPLRNVDKNCSLVDIIIAEHEQLRNSDTHLLTSVLNGQTNHKVLLLLDGYDEYTPGTNSDIDSVIQSSIGKCFTILTSRPEHDSKEEKIHFVPRHMRNKMDSEVIIEGFSEENIKKCSARYLDSEDLSEEMLKMSKESNIYNLLSVPIILLMVCVLYNEHEKLPKSRTEIFQLICTRVMDRSTLKYFGCKAAELGEIDNMLGVLGKFAWEALQDDVRQLLLRKVHFCILSVLYKSYHSTIFFKQYTRLFINIRMSFDTHQILISFCDVVTHFNLVK